MAAAFNGRRLDNPELRRFLTDQSSTPSHGGWTSSTLALVSLYYHPGLDSARGAWLAAQAGEISAGQRPQPGGQAGLSWASNPRAGESPWTVGLTTLVTVELGGKRPARVALARAASFRAELGLYGVAWRLVQSARQTALEVIRSERDLAAAKREVEATREVVTRVEARFAEGAVSAADVAQVRGDLQLAVSNAEAVRRGWLEARARLARALAIPAMETDSLSVLPGAIAGCDTVALRLADSTRARALRQRYDVGIALAAYTEAELAVRLEIARQYPNLVFGPGLTWDQGVLKWAIGFGLPAILFNRNRGPIAEAEARRALAAVQVDAVQQRVLGELSQAVAGCRGARLELLSADSLLGAASRTSDVARAKFARGESPRAELALADLALGRARRVRSAAESRWLSAGLQLETAAGGTLAGPALVLPDLRVSPRPHEVSP